MAESNFPQCFLDPERKPLDPTSLNLLACTIPEGMKALLEGLQTNTPEKSALIGVWMNEGMDTPGSRLMQDKYDPQVETKELGRYFSYFNNILFLGTEEVGNLDGE